MFIIRRITSENLEYNEILGIDYTLTLKSENPQEFLASELTQDECYGCITCYEGTRRIPLYKRSRYYVMLGDGNTFSNVTYKGDR